MPSRPSIPTRPSLIARLRTGDDVEGWEEFYRAYGDLLRRFALQGGLTETEAEEVVRETAIGVARNLPRFRYDPAKCSFKSWLLNLARWRVVDQQRRRGRIAGRKSPRATSEASSFDAQGEDSSRTRLLERIPDPVEPAFGEQWDQTWRESLWKVALNRLRETADPRQFQIFDLYVLKERPAREVASRLGVSVARVYLAKQRLTRRLRRLLDRLEAAAGLDF